MTLVWYLYSKASARVGNKIYAVNTALLAACAKVFMRGCVYYDCEMDQKHRFWHVCNGSLLDRN